MKKENMMLIGLGIVVVVGLIIAFVSVTSDEGVNKQDLNFEAKMTGTTELGDVAIELTPHKVQSGKLEVDISMNTHSVDMSPFDLKKSTTLEYDGKIIFPVSSPALSGHHNYGKIVFNVDEEISNFKIIIRGIPQLEERVFEW